MVVVAIIAIISAVALPAYGEHVLRGRLTAAVGVLKDLRGRMEQRYADNRSYAATIGGCAIANFSDNDSRFAFTCALGDGGQSYLWTAIGPTGNNQFTYNIDEAGFEQTIAAPAGWTIATLPVNRFIVKKGG